jgi:hypothetical protein
MMRNPFAGDDLIEATPLPSAPRRIPAIHQVGKPAVQEGSLSVQ